MEAMEITKKASDLLDKEIKAKLVEAIDKARPPELKTFKVPRKSLS